MTVIVVDTRDDLVRHLTVDHGLSPAVAAVLSPIGARIAHADAHRAGQIALPHAHAAR